uniref:Uncharacterized protein n=1 Tax=Oryza barthii TaxID=65489 RepID=A0A0D3HQA3_9ORYZ
MEITPRGYIRHCRGNADSENWTSHAIAFMGIPSKDVLLQHQPQLALGCVTRKENFGCDGKLGVWGKFGVI